MEQTMRTGASVSAENLIPVAPPLSLLFCAEVDPSCLMQYQALSEPVGIERLRRTTGTTRLQP